MEDQFNQTMPIDFHFYLFGNIFMGISNLSR